MRTVVLGHNPEIDAMIARRRSWGADRFDEVWDGDYHMAPPITGEHALVTARLLLVLDPLADAARLIGSAAFNLGEPSNHRVPDLGYHHEQWGGWGVLTAAVVVEVVNPDDETYEKLGFYASRGVDEIIVADPTESVVRLFRLDGGQYEEVAESRLLGVAADELKASLEWPR
jgi:hypothetical protein